MTISGSRTDANIWNWYGRQPDGEFDLFKFSSDEIDTQSQRKLFLQQLSEAGIHPDSVGAYAFEASECPGLDQALLAYPLAPSPIIYIGETAKPHSRFKEHLRGADGAAYALDHGEQKEIVKSSDWVFQRLYAYAAGFAPIVHWWHCAVGETSKQLESKLLTAFTQTFGTIPVGNGKSSSK